MPGRCSQTGKARLATACWSWFCAELGCYTSPLGTAGSRACLLLSTGCQSARLPVCQSARGPGARLLLATVHGALHPIGSSQQPAASSTSQRCWVLVALCRVIGSSALADKCRGSAEPIAGSGGSSQSHRAVQKLETGRSHLTEQQQQSPPAVACAGLARVDGRRRKPRCSQ